MIRLQDASLAFGDVPLLHEAELTIESGERLCLVGRNGTGKSTLLNVLSQCETLDSGNLVIQQGLRIARLDQEVPELNDSTLYEVVSAGLGDHQALLLKYHEASQQLANADERTLQAFSQLQQQVEESGAWAGAQRIDSILDRLRLPADLPMSAASGGMRRRTMLGQALVSEPDVLLLDEPTNHLDIDAIESLEQAILGYPGTVLFVTHDRSFMDRLATRVIELDRGVLRSFPGSWDDYRKRKLALLKAEQEANRQFDKSLAEEEVWIRQGIKARRTRNEGRVRRLEQMRRERAARLEQQGRANMQISAGNQSGKRVFVLSDVTFSHDDRPVIRDFSTTVQRGDRIGIIGPNGCGKSTLLRLMLGEIEPQAGTVETGTQLTVAYFDQQREQLKPDSPVRDNVADGNDFIEINGKRRHVVSHLNDFLFTPARINSPVSSLSGGERNRLMLARLFARPANLAGTGRADQRSRYRNT